MVIRPCTRRVDDPRTAEVDEFCRAPVAVCFGQGEKDVSVERGKGQLRFYCTRITHLCLHKKMVHNFFQQKCVSMHTPMCTAHTQTKTRVSTCTRVRTPAYCNRRNFRTRFNFVLSAESTKFSSIRKPCTNNSTVRIGYSVPF